MRVAKFMMLHVLVDSAFVYAVTKAVIFWMNGNVIIGNLLPITVLIAFILIGLYNVRNQGLIRSIADVALGFFIFIWYKSSVNTSYDILQSDIWFIVILRGLIGLALGLGAFTLFRKFICSYLKAAQIYCISQKEDAGLFGSLLGVVFRFKFTVSIPVFNSVIHSIFHDIFSAISCDKAKRDSSQSTEESSGNPVALDENTETTADSGGLLNNPIIERLQKTPVIRASKSMLKTYISYLDECVLAYCYRNPDKGLFKGSIEAIQIALVHSVNLLGQIAIIVFINAVIKFAIIACYVVYVVKVIRFQFILLIISLIIVRCIIFIVQDAICEPLIMTSILRKFCAYELTPENTEEVNEEKLRSIIPSFDKLNKFKKGQEESVNEN